MQNEKLLPCPFCGGEADIHHVSEGAHAQCFECEASSRIFDGVRDGRGRDSEYAWEDAFEAWNTRAPIQSGEQPRPDEAERYCLGLLVEEGGEADQLIGKALRFGFDTPGVKRLDGTIDMDATPRTMLAIELGDKLAAIRFAEVHGIIDAEAVDAAASAKFAKLTDPLARDNLGRPLAPQPVLTASSNAVQSEASGDDVERVARIIAPGAWAVMDAEKARFLRKYKGQNIGYPADQWQHKESMATARAALSAIQSRDAGLREALDELAQAESRYRYAHDILGAGDLKTGRAWDLMRRAGDKARATLGKEGDRG